MERLINVFGGKGFVGGRFCELNSNVVRNGRVDYIVSKYTSEVLYFISTIDNYNVHKDLHIDVNTNLTILLNVLEDKHATTKQRREQWKHFDEMYK